MRYGVTGTAAPFEGSYEIIEETIADLDDADEFTTGGAYVVDSYAAEMGFKYLADCFHRLCFPKGKRWNAELPDLLEEDGYVFDDLEAVSGGYMKRNDRIVYHSDVLLAFPRKGTEELRSGTWATIRRGRNKGIPVWVYPLNGDKPWKENES